MERFPMTDELHAKRPTVVHPANITHRAGVDLWSVGHLIPLGLASPTEDRIGHKLRVWPHSLDHSGCRSVPRCLAWADEPHRWLVQRDPMQVISEYPLI